MEGRSLKRADLIIIGGGITGAGCLTEAAARGFRPLLLEKGDFSSGTTSLSSRLIHGGIRYLELFQFGLVKESLKERYWISKTFPHLLKPLAIHIPVYGWGKRSLLIAGLGVRLYDLLAGGMGVGKSMTHFHSEARHMIPEISSRGLTGVCIFHDYQVMMPERLALEHLFAAEDMGARTRTHVRVNAIVPTDQGYRVTGRDVTTGEDETYETPAVINATGPWVDDVRAMAGLQGKLLRPTKGVHIEVRQLSDKALFVEAGSDRRLFFMLPFMGHTIIGTTDNDFHGNPDEVCPSGEDLSYLIDNANRVLKEAKLDLSQLFSAWGGLRPLINVPGRKESAVPRTHRVVCEGQGGRFISIIGGKLTTYRKMAEDTLRKTMKVIGKEGEENTRGVSFPCGNIGPQERIRLEDHLTREHGVGRRSAATLITLYGARAEEVLRMAGDDNSLKMPLSPYTHEIPAQIIFGFEKEGAATLDDIMLRRMLLGKSPGKGLDAERGIQEVLTRHMGKPPSEAEGLWDEARARITKKFMVNPALYL